MSAGVPRLVIGYSVFDTGQECYEYNEDACFIASTRESAQQFLSVACVIPEDGRVDAVSC